MLKISVAIVTRNRPNSLERCLISWRSQTVRPFEIIVSDDSDDNNTSEIQLLCERFDCRYIQGPRRGLYANRNNAALACSGTHILTGDDDHTHPDDYIQKIIQQVAEHPDRIWIFGERSPHNPELAHCCPAELHISGFGIAPNDPNNCFAIADGSTIYPRVIFDRGLRYDETYSFGAIWYLWGIWLFQNGFHISYAENIYIFHHNENENRFVNQKSLINQFETMVYVTYLWSFVINPSTKKQILFILYTIKKIIVPTGSICYEIKARLPISSAFRAIRNAFLVKDSYLITNRIESKQLYK